MVFINFMASNIKHGSHGIISVESEKEFGPSDVTAR